MDFVLKNHPTLKTFLVDEILEMINSHRLDKGLDETKLTSVVNLFIDLDLYQQDFHPALIDNTKKFYQKHYSTKAIDDSASLKEYLNDVFKCINEEKSRIH